MTPRRHPEEIAMTPQERQLLNDLFERLAALENEPRDPEAEQLIREGLARAPHAVYPLVQSVLVQDEALRLADATIQELEAALRGTGAPEQRGFLDNMRDAVFGREEPRGSVPTVRPGERPMGVPPQYRQDAGGPAWGGGGPQAAPMGQEPGRGGSFLGTAAAAAAGMLGGGLLLDGIRGMLGGHQQRGPAAGALDEVASGGSRNPWGGREGGGELAREAGLEDVGRGGRSGLFDTAEHDRDDDRSAGLFDGSDEDPEYDEASLDDDFGDGSDEDTA
jgi:hypothetical protein